MKLNDARLSMNATARHLQVHVATIWRWTLHGVRGQRLRTMRIGGRRFVFARDLEAFLASLNSTNDNSQPADDRRARADAAGQQLDALGVKGVQYRD